MCCISKVGLWTNDSDGQIKEEFQAFGNILELRRPRNHGSKKPTQFAFIVYDSEDAATAAIFAMDGKDIWDSRLSAGDGDTQDSYFTQDTGMKRQSQHPFIWPIFISFAFQVSLPMNSLIYHDLLLMDLIHLYQKPIFK
jgi:RNA recognition motif-containing protein